MGLKNCKMKLLVIASLLKNVYAQIKKCVCLNKCACLLALGNCVICPLIATELAHKFASFQGLLARSFTVSKKIVTSLSNISYIKFKL